jgi:hypothetical protein
MTCSERAMTRPQAHVKLGRRANRPPVPQQVATPETRSADTPDLDAPWCTLFLLEPRIARNKA